MLCVFGILKTEAGLKIKEEMLDWLKPIYDIVEVEQEPPGIQFEYPAIKKTCELALEKNEPVLYIHTKGAANDTWIQKPVRHLWKTEFGKKQRAEELFRIANCDTPHVVCPYSGQGRETWFNGFIINPSAASILIANLKKPDDCERHYYEQMFKNLKDIKIFCSVDKNCDNVPSVLNVLHKYMKENGL